LINVIKKSLVDIRQAIKGLEVITSELETLGNEILAGVVPTLWKAHSYLSNKSLYSWTKNLVERISYFQNWIDNGEPNIFWISGFFLPRNLIQGTIHWFYNRSNNYLAFMQRFARKKVIPLDQAYFTAEVMDEEDLLQPERLKPSTDACYLHGLYLEGARWDNDKKIMVESQPKELFFTMPIVSYNNIFILLEILLEILFQLCSSR
jgi:dynein heavy chain